MLWSDIQWQYPARKLLLLWDSVFTDSGAQCQQEDSRVVSYLLQEKDGKGQFDPCLVLEFRLRTWRGSRSRSCFYCSDSCFLEFAIPGEIKWSAIQGRKIEASLGEWTRLTEGSNWTHAKPEQVIFQPISSHSPGIAAEAIAVSSGPKDQIS